MVNTTKNLKKMRSRRNSSMKERKNNIFILKISERKKNIKIEPYLFLLNIYFHMNPKISFKYTIVMVIKRITKPIAFSTFGIAKRV